MVYRYREDGSTTVDTFHVVTTSCRGVVTKSNVLGPRVGTIKGMHDQLVPNYRKRSAMGEIFNNPMTRVVQTFDGGGHGNTVVRTTPCPTPPADGTYSTEYEHSMTHYNAKFQFAPVRDDSGKLTHPDLRLVDSDSLITLAATAALAGVDASTADGLLMFAEARKTLDYLRNPLKAAYDFIRKYPPPRPRVPKFAKTTGGTIQQQLAYARKLANSERSQLAHASNAVSSQYLSWYYGFLPLMMDVENVLEALTDLPDVYRQTSRGKKTASATEITSEVIGGCSKYSNQFTYTEEVEARSGILYLPTGGFGRTWGTRLSDIPSTLWELIPYSFVVDWFVNVGDFVAAMQPRFGISYLTAWDTLKLKQSWRAETLSSYFSNTCTGSAQTVSGNEWATLVIETTIRTPKLPSENVGLGIKNLNFPTTKTLAAVSLITAALTRR